MLRRKFKPILIGCVFVAFFVWFHISHYPPVEQLRERIELLLYDVRLTATLPQDIKTDKRIVIVDIDEDSLRTEGRWPWSRDRLAQLTKHLFDAGAIVVAYDVMFSEQEANRALEVQQALETRAGLAAPVRQALAEIIPAFDHDAQFAKALQQGDSILGYVFHRHTHTSAGALPKPLTMASEAELADVSFITMPGYTANIDTLQSAAKSAGFFSLDADSDGILRRAPLVMRHADQVYASLALEAARVFHLIDVVELQTESVGSQQAISGLYLGKKRFIPTDGEGHVIIPYRGTAQSYQYVSASKVLRRDFPAQVFENAIVLVGTTAEGLFDLRAVPMQSVYPGVEVHANLISALLDGVFPAEPVWAMGANLVLLVFCGLLLTIWLPFLSALYQIMISATILGLFLGFNVWMWTAQGLVLALALPVLLLTSLTMFNLAYGFFTESQGRNKLKHMFGQYVPPELVNIMNEAPERYNFDGESREMTVLFSDIRGFTTLSEKLSATELKDLLNRFFTPMTRVIFDHQGTIDKYVGDMIMAFWGAPVKSQVHALNAVQSAFAMLAEVKALRQQFIADGLPEVSIGIGINTGPMNVGDMGSVYRRAYTVLGDSVNLASRLEGLTRYYDVDLVIGEETYAQVKNDYDCRQLDLVKVKGKTQPVYVYQPIAPKGVLGESDIQTLRRYHDALDLYRHQDWSGARELFNRLLLKSAGNRLYEIYLERIDWYQANPVDRDWDGVFERRSK
ncbi:MAG: adenylate/guanylate cyclase domain-containing protein [Gammaproteobacteria bacterium]